MKKRYTLVLGALFTIVLAMPSWADQDAGWSPDQWLQPRTIQDTLEMNRPSITRFTYSVNAADANFENQGYEAAEYWGQEAKKSRWSTVSYLVDLGDLYHRMNLPGLGNAYYHRAHNVRRQTVEDNVELGLAFLDANRPNTADFYFSSAIAYARSKEDWASISDAFGKLGNAKMAKKAMDRSNKLK